MDQSSYRETHKNDLTDLEIIALIRSNNQSGLYEVLVNRYRSRIIDRVYSLLKDKTVASELANDILSKAYEKLPEFKGNSSFSTWIYAITYNYCIDFLRIRKKMHYPKWNSRHELPEIVDIQEEDFTDLNYARLLTILDRIHPEEKALLMMKYQEDLSLKQMASALRISESALKMRLHRAKARVVYLFRKHYKIE